MENRSLLSRILSVIITVVVILVLVLGVAWAYNKFYTKGTNNTTNTNNTNNSQNLDNSQNNSQDILSDNDSEEELKKEIEYNNTYVNNLDTMKQAALNYYTVDRLPSTVGSSKTMSLAEMQDSKLLLDLIDAEGNACDKDSSKVVVTKNGESEYIVRVELNCNRRHDYIIATIGCYDVCTNKNVTEETDYVTYYEFKKAVSSEGYGCPSGYTLNGNKCYKTTVSSIDATPVYGKDQTLTTDIKYSGNDSYTVYAPSIKNEKVNYSCPSGYTLNGTECVKTTTVAAIDGSSYSCPSGYTLNGTKCTQTVTIAASNNSSYSCPSGYTLNGTQCTQTNTVDAVGNVSYSCPDASYTLSGNKCVKTVYTDATENVSYSCPDSTYKLSGTKCTKTVTENASSHTNYGSWKTVKTEYYQSATQAYENATSRRVFVSSIAGTVCGSPCGNSGLWYQYTYQTRTSSVGYSCPSGYTLDGTKCSKAVSVDATKNSTYSCDSTAKLNGTKCESQVSVDATGRTTYSCADSSYTLSGNKCTKTNTINATYNSKYSCTDASYTLSGDKCTKTNTVNATYNSKHSCADSSYTLSGDKCVKTDKIAATKNSTYEYSCPSGYATSGSGANLVCSQTYAGSKTYYCEDSSYTISGDKCVKVVKGSITGYTCPSGYTLNNKTCKKSSTIVKDATKGATTYKYTWAKTPTLDGWTATGNTKVVKASTVDEISDYDK